MVYRRANGWLIWRGLFRLQVDKITPSLRLLVNQNRVDRKTGKVHWAVLHLLIKSGDCRMNWEKSLISFNEYKITIKNIKKDRKEKRFVALRYNRGYEECGGRLRSCKQENVYWEIWQMEKKVTTRVLKRGLKIITATLEKESVFWA